MNMTTMQCACKLQLISSGGQETTVYPQVRKHVLLGLNARIEVSL